MKNRLNSPSGPTPANRVRLPQLYGLISLVGLFIALSACNANQPGSSSGRQQRLRLTVGDISELTIPARQDSTWQLTATSDNQEVVDVSRKPLDATAPNGTTLPTTGPVIFLIKGVTAGTAKVVFSEKLIGADGTGRVRKTYVVNIANK